MASHTFTRQELYDLVWSEPMIKLAARYRIRAHAPIGFLDASGY